MVKVLNLATGHVMGFVGISPTQAVVAAYAQGTMKDNNTWDYETKYAGQVVVNRLTLRCGDWTAMK